MDVITNVFAETMTLSPRNKERLRPREGDLLKLVDKSLPLSFKIELLRKKGRYLCPPLASVYFENE